MRLPFSLIDLKQCDVSLLKENECARRFSPVCFKTLVNDEDSPASERPTHSNTGIGSVESN